MNFKNRNNYLSVFTLALAVALFGCSTNTKKTAATDTLEEMKEETKEAKEQLKTEYEDAIEAVDRKISGLETEMENTTDDVKEDVSATLNRLKAERLKLADELAALSEATADNWKEVKNESEELLITYQTKIDSLTIKAEELIN